MFFKLMVWKTVVNKEKICGQQCTFSLKQTLEFFRKNSNIDLYFNNY